VNRTEQLAGTLSRLIDDPRFAGRRWNWVTIGQVLGCNQAEARRVIAYLRQNASVVWTVGTFSSDWEIMPTSQVREAVDGMVNQYRHMLTRMHSAQHVAAVLAIVDPDPGMARWMRRLERMHTRHIEDIEDLLEGLLELSAATPAPSETF
jgi:hypothetical protein